MIIKFKANFYQPVIKCQRIRFGTAIFLAFAIAMRARISTGSRVLKNAFSLRSFSTNFTTKPSITKLTPKEFAKLIAVMVLSATRMEATLSTFAILRGEF